MPDYIYLLENRLSAAQQSALKLVRETARDAQMTVFLTGGAVRDLTSGSPVRDLDFSVQGNALKLLKQLEKSGAKSWGSDDRSRTLFLRFPGGVRAEVSSTRREEFPRPGKPVYHWASILEDLRRRDFTANAMALSLNEGSYGLLMDPLNGVADIESRHLRLVSNYGFLDEPARLIRASRFAARLGWELEEKTKTRFENAKAEEVINSLSEWQRAYELEEIGHEEDALRILRVMESEGWMKHLFPAWTSAKADVAGLEQMREVQTLLQMQGVNPDISAASMQLLTAKMAPKDIAAMKHSFVRQGFVVEWNTLDAQAKEFAKVLTSKQVATPSAVWQLLTSYNPDAVLWLKLTGKGAAIQEKYNNFFTVWPEARQKIPYTLMQEMRITPEIEGYQDLLQKIFFELIDGKLQTDEQMRAFLEPFSPPAPPPPVTVRRTRAAKKVAEPKVKPEADEEELLPEGIVPGDDDLLDAEEEEEENDEDLPIAKPTIKGKITATAAKAEAKAVKVEEKKPAKAEEKKKPAKVEEHKHPAKAAVAEKHEAHKRPDGHPKPAKAVPAPKAPAKKAEPAHHAHSAKKAAPVKAPHSKAHAKPAPKKVVAKKAVPKHVAKKAAKPVHKVVAKKTAAKPKPVAKKPAPKAPAKTAAKKKKR